MGLLMGGVCYKQDIYIGLLLILFSQLKVDNRKLWTHLVSKDISPRHCWHRKEKALEIE